MHESIDDWAKEKKIEYEPMCGTFARLPFYHGNFKSNSALAATLHAKISDFHSIYCRGFIKNIDNGDIFNQAAICVLHKKSNTTLFCIDFLEVFQCKPKRK